MSDRKVIKKQQTTIKKYKFCVFQGNYPQYIRDALALRGNWIEV